MNISTIQIFVLGIITIIVFYKLIKFYLNDRKVESDFISVVNHAFRTPLTRISWITKELEKDDISKNQKLLYLQGIENSTKKILRMIDSIVGIRDVNKKSGYNFKMTSMREIVEGAILKYREKINEKKINFKISTFKDIPLITLDLNKISFVIEEIIENSIFYSPNNGNIEIEPKATNSKITLSIKDNGMGMNSKDKRKIFSKFYRSKKAKLLNTDGIGLSLYLSKQIIKKHQGEITFSSMGEEKGSTFIIELPIK